MFTKFYKNMFHVGLSRGLLICSIFSLLPLHHRCKSSDLQILCQFDPWIAHFDPLELIIQNAMAIDFGQIVPYQNLTMDNTSVFSPNLGLSDVWIP